MCMLFIKPKNLLLPENYHVSLVNYNADGVSFFNLCKKELFKTMCNDAAYDYLVKNAQNELIVHYRFGTSGKSTEAQLHGFDIVNNEYLLFHNGVLKSFQGDAINSDTQNMINYFNSNNYDLFEVIQHLEAQETSSRFLIVNKNTSEVIKPNCAAWNDVTDINGYNVQFSNTYAIDYNLLGFNDNPYFDSFYNDQDYDEMLELEYLVQNGTKKELIDFIQVSPDLIADYLKDFASYNSFLD